MALSIQLGFPDVPKSITNPSVNKQNALDMDFPYPFLKFITLINVSFEPDVLQEYYKEYLNSWYKFTNNKSVSEADLILEKYKEFIRELSLKYTTLEEKSFLSKIDFNDPYDLDIAIGFFSKKLKEITQFYNDKRNNIKLSFSRNRSRGTNIGFEKYVIDLTLNYLKNLNDGQILFDYDVIKEKLAIDLDELYDVYPYYFNQTPSTKYDNKDLDYGLDLFIKTNDQVLTETFSDISDELKKLKELDSLLDNKKELTESNVFTNFYYLSTGSTVTDFVSGQLFESTHDITNFLNRDWPTSASTDVGVLKTSREQGFFRPVKTAIVLLDGVNNSYSFNLDSLEPNKLYYFPDPTVFGKNGDILTFIVDDTFLKKNISSGDASNQPTSTPSDTKYYGYVSKIDPNERKYLDYVFDSGYIKDYKKDIYNNSFGLFDNSSSDRGHITIIDNETVISQLWNGYVFYDDLYNEGFSFDYTTTDDSTYTETIRTGLSSNTGFFLSGNVPDITLSFGSFIPGPQLSIPTDPSIIGYTIILENSFIMNDSSIYPETYSSDLSAFELSGIYYYSDLIENGFNNDIPYQRPLVDPSFPSLTANATEFLRSSALNIYDGGDIISVNPFFINIEDTGYDFSSEINNETSFLSVSDIPPQFNGKLFVKNSHTTEILPLLEAFPYYTTKYNPTILNELDDNVVRFEVCNDAIVIETDNYLVIDKIVYTNSKFVDPRKSDITIPLNQNWSNKVSNRFKKGSDIYYAVLNTTTPSITSGVVNVYPTIYKFDTNTSKNNVIYNQSTEYFTISSGESAFDVVTTPTLTYNSRNDIFKLSFILKDQNALPTIVEYDFTYHSDVDFIRRNSYNYNNTGYTYMFDAIPSTLYFYMSSAPIIVSNFELIL